MEKTICYAKAMKRIGNLYNRITSIENLMLADQRARKGKSLQYGVRLHDKHREENIQKLRDMLVNKSYHTSEYSTFKIYEPKEREVYRLPYFPDRIAHHAIMNVMESLFTSWFTADTYSCIKGRGIHAAKDAVEKALHDIPGTKYCLKLDIRKFYPSVDHAILKKQLRRKIKDADLLYLLDEIIDSAPGLPIGNYLSQYFANFYLTGFDHWIKQKKRVRHYFRYADDIVVFASTKEELHSLLAEIRAYLQDHLNLQVKGNYQVFPIDARSLDFCGYRFFRYGTWVFVWIRKSIKQSFARMVMRRNAEKSYPAYMGWLLHAKTRHLVKKITYACIQRHGYCAARSRDGRRKNKNLVRTEHGNTGSLLRVSTLHAEQGRTVPVSSDRSQWNKEVVMDRKQISESNDPESSKGKFSF